ncbi:MAG: hypothetical protein HOA75_15040 [Deltaproteobacteria bacterium]|jgi:hypothetical protein|nr:hypothetical protein [Deltaproteobacteria bacterium]
MRRCFTAMNIQLRHEKYQAAESLEMEVLCPVGVAKRDTNLIHMVFS